MDSDTEKMKEETDSLKEPTLDQKEELSSEMYIDQETIEKLRLGLLQNLGLPEFQKTQATLAELTESQRILIETIQQENTKFGECQALTEVTDCMEKAKIYHAKLLNIRKEMSNLHERSGRIKKRAEKLKMQKEKEALIKEQKREHDRKVEEQLLAKPRPVRSKSASS